MSASQYLPLDGDTYPTRWPTAIHAGSCCPEPLASFAVGFGDPLRLQLHALGSALLFTAPSTPRPPYPPNPERNQPSRQCAQAGSTCRRLSSARRLTVPH